MKQSRMLLALMLFVCFSGSGYCQQKSPTDPKEVALAMFAAFNAHQWDKMTSYYAADALLEDPAYPAPVRGTTGMAQRYRELQQQYPDLQDRLKHIFVSNNTVIVEFTASGTAADGSHQFSLPIVCVLTIQNGKIVRDATYYDLQP